MWEVFVHLQCGISSGDQIKFVLFGGEGAMGQLLHFKQKNAHCFSKTDETKIRSIIREDKARC